MQFELDPLLTANRASSHQPNASINSLTSSGSSYNDVPGEPTTPPDIKQVRHFSPWNDAPQYEKMPITGVLAPAFDYPSHLGRIESKSDLAKSGLSVDLETSLDRLTLKDSPFNRSARPVKKALEKQTVSKLASVPFESLDILSLAKDQHGCRFLQKKIEQDPTSHVPVVFNRIHLNTFELMIDPFGNYLVQKVIENCTSLQKDILVKNAAPNLFSIALNQHGTRALQKMIDCVSSRYQISMICDSLKNHVVQCIQDLNGNHVIQKCIKKLSNQDSQFIIDSITENMVKVSTHKHGCCVMQKCLNSCNYTQLNQLGSEIIRNAIKLMQDPFGNYVVQYLVSLSNPFLNERLILTIAPALALLSQQKFSSNVVEKCLRNSPNERSKRLILDQVIALPNLCLLIKDQYGNYVIQTALDVADNQYKLKMIQAITPLLQVIKTTPFGKRIQSKISNILAAWTDYSHPNLINQHFNYGDPLYYNYNYMWPPAQISKPNQNL